MFFPVWVVFLVGFSVPNLVWIAYWLGRLRGLEWAAKHNGDAVRQLIVLLAQEFDKGEDNHG